MITTLYYVHDPMCSWCWAFRPVWADLRSRLPASIEIRYLLGGLAPDSDVPMPEEMRQFLQQTWRKIQTTVPGTEFNFDFWSRNTPRRSTYPACRAVISARKQNPEIEEAMILAIQQAYYLEAINPSDDENLAQLAENLELNKQQFLSDLNSSETRLALQADIDKHQTLGARGFPSLILQQADALSPVFLSYTDADAIYDHIAKLTA